MVGKSLGRIQIASHTLGYLEDAIKYSFEARRGKLYQALRALNAMAVVDLTRQVTPNTFTQRELEVLAGHSLDGQMEKELMDEFRFSYLAGKARRKFKDLDGVLQALEVLIPQFDTEIRQRRAEGTLGRKGGVLRWLLGIQEVGSIEELLKFANASLWFAQCVMDEGSEFHHLENRIIALSDLLAEKK